MLTLNNILEFYFVILLLNDKPLRVTSGSFLPRACLPFYRCGHVIIMGEIKVLYGLLIIILPSRLKMYAPDTKSCTRMMPMQYAPITYFKQHHGWGISSNCNYFYWIALGAKKGKYSNNVRIVIIGSVHYNL